MDIVKGSIGSAGAYDVAFVGGKLVITGSDAGVSASITVDAEVIGAAIVAKLPAGSVEVEILNVFLAAIKA